jgi:hypothetical protein
MPRGGGLNFDAGGQAINDGRRAAAAQLVMLKNGWGRIVRRAWSSCAFRRRASRTIATISPADMHHAR